MKKICTRVVLPVIFLAFALSYPAIAQEKGHIELTCIAETEIETVNEKGEKEIQRVEASKVVPGDTVIYTIFYTVIGNDTVNDVVINNPIPEHMVYKGETALGEGASVTFSIDGGKVFDSPENLKVKDEEDKERVAMASEYTHIRWSLTHAVKPGQTGQVSYRAQLE
ncbi:MAG: hypothetical protein ACMUIL_08080 [bacterium]